MLINVDPNNSLQSALSDLQRKLVNPAPAMRTLAGIMQDAVEQNFADEGRPTKWAPLASATLKSKPKRRGGKILQDTGRLAGSITTAYSATFALVGTNVVYAPLHQFGGKAGREKKVSVPARPFLVLTDEDLNEMEQVVLAYLES